MSNLYKDALIESQNLKKLAEEDAKKKILEEISPLIKKAITDQINESVSESFFVEDNADDNADAKPEASTNDTAGLINTQLGGLQNPQPEAPIAPKNTEPSVMSATMPGDDGKITVDFEDLFISDNPLGMDEPVDLDSTPPVPVEEPTTEVGSDVPPMEVTKESFEREIAEVAEKINEAFYLDNLTIVGKEKIQQNLFQLLEKLDFLKNNKIINEHIAQKNENKLDFLFLKLKEAKLSNSYIETDRRDSNKMKSLKEYAAKLFEEDSTYSETADNKINHGTTASDEHAMKQSGVSPEVGGPSDLDAKTEKQNVKTTSEEPWEDGEPCIKEEVDVDEAELKEAIECLTKEPAKEEGWEEGKPEEKDPSHKNLKENVGDEIEPVDSDLDDSDSLSVGGDTDDSIVDPDIVLNIELPDEIEDALANIDVSSIGDIKVDVAETNFGGEPGVDLSDEVEEDIDLDFSEDDSDKKSVDDIATAEEEEDKDEEKEDLDEAMKLKEAFTSLLKKHKVLEAKLAQVEAENKALKESVQKHRTSLQEANLFLAKNVYFTKFLQRNDISKKNLKKIVEYLDRAETVNDAKNIYNKIKARLAESAKASNKLVGSPSKVTTPGSVTPLNESAKPSLETEDGLYIDASRWAVIAGIKKSN